MGKEHLRRKAIRKANVRLSAGATASERETTIARMMRLLLTKRVVR